MLKPYETASISATGTSAEVVTVGKNFLLARSYSSNYHNQDNKITILSFRSGRYKLGRTLPRFPRCFRLRTAPLSLNINDLQLAAGIFSELAAVFLTFLT
jgi:hypothetical protein